MNDSLTHLRVKVDAAREAFAASKKAFHKAEATARIAQGAARDERIEASLVIQRGGPRPAPGYKPPPTALELAATVAQEKLDAAHLSHASAEAELKRAEAVLLRAENAILDRWRTVQALAIQALQREDAPAELIASKLAELRTMCPPEQCVRLHQRFTLSTLVRDVLGDRPDELHLDTPVSELRGENASGYEAKRAEILAAAEAAYDAPLEAA